MIQVIGAALGFRPATYPTYTLNGVSAHPFYTIARPGFWGGFGGWLDIFSPVGWNYPQYQSLDEANAISTYSDWVMVGQDLYTVIQRKAA
jgi:hypothetical protein